MPPLKTYFEVVIPFQDEEEANLFAQRVSNDVIHSGVGVREVAE